MAVLVEAISLIFRAEVIVEKYPGGWEALESNPPNATLCADGPLVRIGFMASADVKAYAEWLEQFDIRYVVNGSARDFVVADQRAGFSAPCDWAKIYRVHYGGDPSKVIAACLAVDCQSNEVVTPIGWEFENSLSHRHKFVPTDLAPEFLDSEGHVRGLDVYKEIETGKRVYVGRTHPPEI